MRQYIILFILLVSCGIESSNRPQLSDFRLSKKSYNAIDSAIGRGKYIIIRFDEPRCCKAAQIEEFEQSNLKNYQLESFDGECWTPFYSSMDSPDKEFIVFCPTITRAVRLHHVRAEKIPCISKFTLYEEIF